MCSYSRFRFGDQARTCVSPTTVLLPSSVPGSSFTALVRPRDRERDLARTSARVGEAVRVEARDERDGAATALVPPPPAGLLRWPPPARSEDA